MSILKELIETAAGGTMGVTSAPSIAGFRSPFFDGGKKKKKKKKMQRRGPVGSVYSFKLVGEGYNFSKFLQEAEESDFDSGDVISKLKSSEKAAEEHGEDTVAFALEDENGNLVKVWVPNDQADDFESSLQNALSGNDEDEDDENDNLEIAEVLWKLRKDYDIVNIEWGEIPEDQEQTTPVPGETGQNVAGGAAGGAEAGVAGAGGAEAGVAGAGGAEAGAGGAEVPPGEEGGAEGEMTAEPGVGEEETAKSALQQVIDAMKADAEARKAEAEAKTAEAKAKEAEAASKQAESKLKQEEEVLDMETYYKNKKEEDDEAKRLAKLAKYRHDIAGDAGESLNGGMEEELPKPEEDDEMAVGGRGRGAQYISRAELGGLVMNALRRQR
jgi:hypothetical protein